MSMSCPLRDLNLSKEEYAVQDEILKYISSNFVSLQPCAVKFFNHHLENVTKQLIKMMRQESELFNLIFQRDRVAGSYWDKLKIGKPVEFDKNLVLYLPSEFHKNIRFFPASPSYVTVNVQNGLEATKSSKIKKYRDDWLDEKGNIMSDKVRFWMEGVVTKAITKCLPKLSNKKYKLVCEDAQYEIGTRKSGPAITVEVDIISSNYKNTKFCIDLVPAFEFQEKDWPSHIQKCPANSKDKTWQLVPKPLKPEEGIIPPCQQWRLSFHNQESAIIHDLYHFKAVLKLLKKLRDLKFDQNTMSSYALKTVFMLEKKKQDNLFWQKPLSFTFLHMLTALTDFYEKGEIPFYWDKEDNPERHNLLGKLTNAQITQVYSTLQNINKRIYDGLQNKCDYFIIASSLLNEKELLWIKEDITIENCGNRLLAKRRV